MAPLVVQIWSGLGVFDQISKLCLNQFLVEVHPGKLESLMTAQWDDVPSPLPGVLTFSLCKSAQRSTHSRQEVVS